MSWGKSSRRKKERIPEEVRERRQKEAVARIALVGYTNAGKSTLLNALTGAGVLAEDKLFATLDPVVRQVALPNGSQALLSDTVGFINKLPHELVTAFHSTLEEVRQADLILHVVDASATIPARCRWWRRFWQAWGREISPASGCTTGDQRKFLCPRMGWPSAPCRARGWKPCSKR